MLSIYSILTVEVLSIDSILMVEVLSIDSILTVKGLSAVAILLQTTTYNLRVNLVDVNDNSPIFIGAPYNTAVNEVGTGWM